MSEVTTITPLFFDRFDARSTCPFHRCPRPGGECRGYEVLSDQISSSLHPDRWLLGQIDHRSWRENRDGTAERSCCVRMLASTNLEGIFNSGTDRRCRASALVTRHAVSGSVPRSASSCAGTAMACQHERLVWVQQEGTERKENTRQRRDDAPEQGPNDAIEQLRVGQNRTKHPDPDGGVGGIGIHQPMPLHVTARRSLLYGFRSGHLVCVFHSQMSDSVSVKGMRQASVGGATAVCRITLQPSNAIWISDDRGRDA